MNIFLKKLIKKSKGQKIVIVIDGAGWHRSDKSIISKNIRIIMLSPYSPELNPAEKLWQYIKNHTIKNRVYKTLKELEGVVCKFVKALTAEIIRSVCGISYV